MHLTGQERHNTISFPHRHGQILLKQLKIKHVLRSRWILEGNDNKNRAKGASQTPGNGTDMDAYRAELYGIYCILLSVKYISEHFQIRDGEIKIICDCKGALTRSIIYDDRPTTRHPNYDLLWSILDLRDNI